MNFNLSSKQKILVFALSFMAIAAFLFLYGYQIIDRKNHSIALQVAEGEQEFQDLLYEQIGFEQGRRDLEQIEESAYPPSSLFPKNTTLVENIRVLENLASRYNLTFTISLSGTGEGNAAATGVVTSLFIAPYTVALSGEFRDVMAYIQTLENLSFPTHTQRLTINAIAEGQVNVTLNSQFFVEK